MEEALKKYYNLSPAEIKVCKELKKGMSNKSIGRELGILPATVKWHLWSIFKKMKIKSRAQLIIVLFTVTQIRH